MIDYDVAIIGGTTAGLYAAVAAAYMQARVALVLPPIEEAKNSLNAGFSYSKILAEVGKFAREIRRTPEFGIYSDNRDILSQKLLVNFEEAMAYAGGVVANLEAKYEPAVLSSLGVDVVIGNGKFVDTPHMAFVVKGRHLRSRTYLLATASQPITPNIDGLDSTGFVTIDEIGKFANKKLPESLIVIGGDPSSTELSQAFARLGTNVNMVVKGSRILAKEDAEAAFLLQSQLEGEGVNIFTETEVSQVREIDGKKWIQAGNEAVESDEILLAAGLQHNFDSLNLAAVGVKLNRRGLKLNNKLQTTNSRIYACGDIAGGYAFENIAIYEAKVALKNMVYLPFFKVDYLGIPWGINCHPQLARVGLTEEQARRRYGDDVLVCRRFFKDVDKAEFLGETTGFFKLVARRNGDILGASVLGPQANELVAAVALAIRQRLKVGAIAELWHIWPSFGEIVGEVARLWLKQKRDENRFVRDMTENLFHWRRSWL